MDIINQLGTIGGFWAGAAYVTQLIMNGINRSYPKRPAWVAWVASLLIGVMATLLLALANGVGLTTQTGAQIVIVGIIAAGGAKFAADQAVRAEIARADQEK